jgi:hypothetical protein
MTEETKLLRTAVEASVLLSQPVYCDGDDFSDEAYFDKMRERREAADRAWKDYDLCIWVQRYVP